MPLKGLYTPSEIRRVQEIAIYLEQHYKEKITIQHLAEEAGIDSKLLQQIFSFINGVPIHQFQLHYRLEKIKEGLQNFEWSIEGIAKQHGIRSSKYFYRFFKKQTGMTAQEYRRQLLQNSNSLLYIHENGHKKVS